MNKVSSPRYFHRDNLPPIDLIYSKEELELTPWYYSVEMEPGRLTPAQAFSNVALTRLLLQRTDLNDKDCLDIGTMEGVIPTLMKRRGARKAVAYDRPSALTTRIEAVKDRFDVDFDFVSGIPLAELSDRLDHRTFDVVVMSGILYHLFSPLSGLATARGLLRNGGIMILETAAVIDAAPAMHWNSNFRFLGEAYFFPTLACLDYFVRFLRMEIIDCAYIESHRIDGLRTARVGLACRAIDRPVGPVTDGLLQGTLHTEMDVAEQPRLETLQFRHERRELFGPELSYSSQPVRRLQSDQASHAKSRIDRPFQFYRLHDRLETCQLLAAARLQIDRPP